MRKKFSVLNPCRRSVLIRGFRFCGWRELSFLVGRQVTDDHLAFRRYAHLQIDRDFTMQSDRHCVFANTLQRLAQVNSMTIDLVATLL